MKKSLIAKSKLLVQVLLICSLSNVALASMPIKVDVKLQNKSWFPLEVSEMKSAAVGAALHELTRKGDFQIVTDDGVDSVGALKFEVILIERAQMLQVKITLAPQNSASFFTHSSASLNNTDYQGIYSIFEAVGKTAAEQLLERFHQSGVSGKRIVGTIDGHSDLAASKLFDAAQEAKLQHKFEEAKSIFQRLVNIEGKGTKNWAVLSKDELRYGLPLLRADVLTRFMQEKVSEGKNIAGIAADIDSIYTSIIHNNADKPMRVQQAQTRRDQLQQMEYYMNKASSAQNLSRLTVLKINLIEYMSSMGEFPKQAVVNEWLQSSRSTRVFNELSRSMQSNELRIILQNKQDKSRYEVLAEKYDYVQIRRL